MGNFFKKIIALIMKPEMKVLPGQLAFFIILAIFPLLTLIGYVGSNISMFASAFTNIINDILPKDVLNIILPFITESEINGNVAFFMIVGFILVSNGTNSLIIASNELFGISSDNYLKRRIKAFFMIILLMALLIFIVLVLAYGNVIVKTILSKEVFVSVADKLYMFFILLKWPIAIALIFLAVKLLYAVAPDDKIPSKYMNYGALFTTLGWVIITSVYSYYISNFANYTMFYGSISGVIAMMIWVYFLSFVLVLGIAINANHYNENKKYNMIKDVQDK